MSSAIEKHPLGLPMLEGYNSKVIIKANSFYASSIYKNKSNDSVYITRYKYIVSIDHNLSRVKNDEEIIQLAKKEGFGVFCEICGNPLFKQIQEGPIKRMRLKKQLILIDNLSRKHYTCYKVQSCYKKAGHETDFTTTNTSSCDYEHPIGKFILPSLKEVLDSIDYYRNDLSEVEKENYHDKMINYYNDHIKSFLRKWIVSEIDKNNLASFIFGFDKMKECLININDSRLQNDFIIKIFEIVGINEIKDRSFLKEKE